MARTSTLTFVLTDIEGSTRLAQRLGEARFVKLIDEYRTMLAEVFTARGGIVQLRADEVLGVFARASDAVSAALEAQRMLGRRPSPGGTPLRVRMGIHAGEATFDEGEYTGLALHRTARICAAGHGGQVLVSLAARELLSSLPEGCSLIDIGEHVMRDIDQPERLAQLAHEDLQREFPPLRGERSVERFLARYRTPLVGRFEAVDEATKLIQRVDVRHVTVTGPGGVGKSRFALEVADRVAGEFPDGVAFVALAAISDPALVPSAIAGALGLREAGSTDFGGICQWLSRREMLLLLDNFEQVVGAAPMIPQLLRDCPGVKVMVTSRGALRVLGEHCLTLPPLAIPDRSAVAAADIGALLSVPGVALFMERAQVARPDFDAVANGRPCAELCRRLDGLPLAIELAAASLRLLTPDAMLQRLDRNVAALAPAARDAPDRHASLSRAIDWSYDLLSVAEQRVFRRLSVFVGGCTIEAAEAVTEAGDDFLQRLDGLVSQSLLRTEVDGPDIRLAMLETIGEYGRGQLSTNGDERAVRDAHARYFLEVAASAAPAMRSPQREAVLHNLERDHDNLRAALTHLLASGPADDALRMVAALARFWRDHGHLTEGRRWLDEALRVGASRPSEVRMPVVLGAALVAYEDDLMLEAAAFAEEARTYFRDVGDARSCIEASEVLADIDRYRGDRSEARARYEQALVLAQELDDPWIVAHLTDRKGIAAWAEGDYQAAAAALEASLHAFRSLGDSVGATFALWELGSTDAQVDRLALGITRMEEAVAALRGGRHRRQLARALCNLGVAYVRAGDLARAEPTLVEGMVTFQSVKVGRHLSCIFPAFAAVALARDHPEQAAKLLGATEQTWQAAGWTPPLLFLELWDRCARQARRQLGTPRFDLSRGAGRALTLDEAIEEAVRPATTHQAGLTPRELEILTLLDNDLTNAEISNRLFVSVRTVHAHLRSLYAKLGVGSRAAAVQRAAELGIALGAQTDTRG